MLSHILLYVYFIPPSITEVTCPANYLSTLPAPKYPGSGRKLAVVEAAYAKKEVGRELRDRGQKTRAPRDG